MAIDKTMNRSRVILLITLFLLTGGVTLCADELLLSSRGKYVGTITDESDTEVTIKTVAGTFTLDKSEVRLIVRGKAVRAIYAVKRAQLGYGDVDGHYQLGLWCRANELPEEAILQFEYCLRVGPKHARAHLALGHTRHQRKWVTKEEMRAQGFEKYKGSWLSREEVERLRQADLKKRLEAEWAARIQRLKYQVTHSVVSFHSEAEKQLLEISDPAAFPAIVRLLEDYHARVRLLALELVNRHRIPEAAPMLARLTLLDPDPRLSDAARVTLVDIKDEEAFKVLIKGLRHRQSGVRHRACVALGLFKDARAVPFLILSIKELFLVSVKKEELPSEEKTELPPLAYHSLSDRMTRGVWTANSGPDKKLVIRINQDAIDALRTITGEDFGDDEDAWQNWWRKEVKRRSKQKHKQG